MEQSLEFEAKLDALYRKTLKGMVEGKITFVEGVEVDIYQKHLDISIRLEEYEASALLRDEIKKKFDGTVL